jgi:hypothetical protein
MTEHGSHYVRPPFLEQAASRGGAQGGTEAISGQAGKEEW